MLNTVTCGSALSGWRRRAREDRAAFGDRLTASGTGTVEEAYPKRASAPTNRFVVKAALVSAAMLVLVIPGFSGKPCASMTIKVEPATLSPGTQAFATGSIKNCSAAQESMLLKYQATGPCDFSFAGTVKADVAAGETKTTTMPFIVPPNACPGTYKLTVSAYLDKVRLATTSASVTVQ
ncbi:MAG TPA: hypothetical protein VI756_31780 [Blastocatellia bacterium]